MLAFYERLRASVGAMLIFLINDKLNASGGGKKSPRVNSKILSISLGIQSPKPILCWVDADFSVQEKVQSLLGWLNK